jgi:hypothetical protein
LKQSLIRDLDNPEFSSDTAFSYSVDVENNQKFISHCGPGEWVVCNCLTEGDDYVRVDQVESVSDLDETDESTNL